ncbi:hypothetical protein BC831DRAFT_27914 [Entophlyctis helioformis]|nr:hypothetical protein BC831DRAFT_27914 [Entophlyctis helioformis]
MGALRTPTSGSRSSILTMRLTWTLWQACLWLYCRTSWTEQGASCGSPRVQTTQALHTRNESRHQAQESDVCFAMPVGAQPSRHW